MKKQLALIFILAMSLGSIAQQNTEKRIESKVGKVTVFFENAQVTRQKSVQVAKGTSVLRFTNLSPFIKPKSIQARVDGAVTVLAVNHQQNYLDNLEKPAELKQLEAEAGKVRESIQLEQARISVINENILFLQENRKLGGTNEILSVARLKEAAIYYNERLTELKIKGLESQKKKNDLEAELRQLQKQISGQQTKKKFPAGEILLKLEAKANTQIKVELSYLVGNAGWHPGYDIRAKSITDPLELVYKAKVHQDTKVPWENVRLRFSSNNPRLSSQAPKLKTYYLYNGSIPPNYENWVTSVSGRVMDPQGNPLPGATVAVANTSIATVSDMDGNYSITLPPDGGNLSFSFLGFREQTVPARNAVQNIYLEEEMQELDELTITGFDVAKETAAPMKKRAMAVQDKGIAQEIKVMAGTKLSPPTQTASNQTTVEFDIAMPYSIPSDNKSYAVEMVSYEVPAEYEYYCVPRIDKDAFLLAYVTGWEKLNLLGGEASIYFEDTYIGKSILDVRNISDTLTLSLGRDRSIAVSREKNREMSDWKTIGARKVDSRAWTLSVKNNKPQAIKMVLLDQVPVPTLEEIELNIEKLSRAKWNKESGEIRWKLELAPGAQEERELVYRLRYPKHMQLIIE